MRLVAKLAVTAAVGVGLLAPAAAAAADSGQVAVNTGTGWTHDATQPLFDLSRIAPGWSGAATVGVRNDSSASGSITLSSTDIVDNENGCDHAESLVDTTCTGDNAGELGHALVFSVHPSSDPSSVLWQGNLYDLESGVTLDSALAPEGVDTYTVDADLPYATGNETQTDSVAFGLRVTLSGDGVSSSTTVEGVKVSRGPQHGVIAQAVHALPFTGSPVGRMLMGAAWLLVAGGLLLSVVRLSRRRPVLPRSN